MGYEGGGEISRYKRLAMLCREAIAHVNCPLERRERRVMEKLIAFSYDLELERAFFGSNEQLALLAEMDKGDVSNALKGLLKRRVITSEAAAPLHGLRRPMVYEIKADVLKSLSTPKARSGRYRAAQAQVAEWLLKAGREYPLQPELFPPDPDLLGPILAELSRASALGELDQNEGPKSEAAMLITSRGGEVTSSEISASPGRMTLPGVGEAAGQKPVSHRDDPAHDNNNYDAVELLHQRSVAELCRRSMMGELGSVGPVGEAPTGKTKEGPTPQEGGVLVGESPTRKSYSPSSWRISNLEPRVRASDVPDVPDVIINNNKLKTSGNIRMEEAPVGGSPTGMVASGLVVVAEAEPEIVYRAPSQAEVLFGKVCEAMGERVIGGYGTWWRQQCREFPQAVYETWEKWRNAKDGRLFKAWGGGRWRDEFFRRRRALEGKG